MCIPYLCMCYHMYICIYRYSGEAEKVIQDIFQKQSAYANTNTNTDHQHVSVIIMDDIDLICPHRSGTGSGSTEVQKRVVTCLLSLLDGISTSGSGSEGGSGSKNEGMGSHRLLLVAASSKPHMIDAALRRPGIYIYI